MEVGKKKVAFASDGIMRDAGLFVMSSARAGCDWLSDVADRLAYSAIKSL